MPATPWLDQAAPGKPQLVARPTSTKVTLNWEPSNGEKAFGWLLQTKSGNKWTAEVLPANVRSQTLSGTMPQTICLTAFDRAGNAGIACSLRKMP